MNITNLVEARRKRTIKQMRKSGLHFCLVLQAGQSSVRDPGYIHEEHVVYSHGDHIPLHVRNASVVALWLPDVLDIAFEAMSLEQARRCFTQSCMLPLLWRSMWQGAYNHLVGLQSLTSLCSIVA